ncbi:protein HGH1 homolog [Bombyx mori]|uniref:Protein HGH1 homolog n=1 Tax=Bombyx mori TaxID=7091 RepID=A0A8R1WJC4_BOMMO|nr:protein HGH1 homolog [Bombyx mori]
MALDSFDELIEFLKPESRIDLRHISMDYLVSLSGTEDGVNKMLEHERITQAVIELTDDRIKEIAKHALLMLVNISAYTRGATELLKYKPLRYKNIIDLLISYVLNPNKTDADAACMTLSNITRLEDELEVCLNTFIPHLNDIMNAFVNTEFNKTGSNLHYLAPMFSNLACSHRIRKWLCEENPHVPLIKLIPFCNYDVSNIRKGGAIGTIRNISFDTDYHEFLVSPDLDLLTYILYPLMGNEDYPDDEMETLPVTLQYLPKEKRREPDIDIRILILETLNKLCAQRRGRQYLRENGVYYIMREYHKWEKDPKALIACENVVDILIQKEDEVGAEDLSTVEVPEELRERFNKTNSDFMMNLQ